MVGEKSRWPGGQLEGAMRARAAPARVFLLSERGRTLGDVAPNREGALARRAAMLCGRLLWIGDVKEIRDLIVNRQKPLCLLG